jgi:hypothetical protein
MGHETWDLVALAGEAMKNGISSHTMIYMISGALHLFTLVQEPNYVYHCMTADAIIIG